MEFDLEASNFNLLINCNENEVKKVKSAPVAADKIEFGVSNNALNWLIPYAYKLRFNSLVDRVMKDYPWYLPYVEEYGLGLARGFFRLT